MAHVLAEITRWASTLSYWEQVALHMVLSGETITDTHYERLLKYLLEDADLQEATGPQRTPLRFQDDGSTSVQPGTHLRLDKISDFRNINSLVEGQTLSFGPNLTVCYGGNGSGKSGYARVLGCAGFTRGDREVLPDVTLPASQTSVRSADIHVSDATGTKIIHYQVGGRCSDLECLYVFDSTSVLVHLTKLNTLSFSPGGLSYLAQLAEVTDQVRTRLQSRIADYSVPHAFSPLFQGGSRVAEAVKNLGPETDLEEVRQLATLSEEELRRINDIEMEIARLRISETTRQIAILRQTLADLRQLAGYSRDLENGLSDASLGNLQQCLTRYLGRKQDAELASLDQFRDDSCKQVGTDTWRSFIEAARALSLTERDGGDAYPGPDDRCLLCGQALSSNARARLLRLWAFLQHGAQARLSEASASLSEARSSISRLRTDFFHEESALYRSLRECDQQLCERVAAFVDAS